MTLLLVHIVAGLSAIVAGTVALSAAKGGARVLRGRRVPRRVEPEAKAPYIGSGTESGAA